MTDVPEASFLNFIGGLAAQGLMQLGDIPNPASGQREEHLEHARYTVEILEILQAKTEGHLDDNESEYLQAAIDELKNRLRARSAGADYVYEDEAEPVDPGNQ